MDAAFPENVESFPVLVRERARLHPDRIACVFLSDDHQSRIEVTYGRLDLEARKVAANIQTALKPGDRAILLYPPGPAFYYALLGCFYSGVIPVPAYPPNRPKDTQHAIFQRFLAILRDADPAACLCTRQIFSRLRPVASAFADAQNLRWMATDDLDDGLARDWSEFAPAPDSIAFLQYTSGSTAQPRGVMVSHANLIANQVMMKRAFRHGEEAVMVSWLPFYHDMGLIGNFMHFIFVGGLTVLMPPFRFLQKPLRWMTAMTEYRVTIMGAPNFAFKYCAEKITEEEKDSLDLSSLDIAVVSAEPVHAPTLETFCAAFARCGFRREAISPAFGLAEATLMSTGGPKLQAPVIRAFDRDELEAHRVRAAAAGERSKELVSSGPPLDGMEIRIVDPETKTPCPPDRIGEIWMRGPSIALGYWRREKDTAEYFRARIAGEGDAEYLRTGDFGFYFEDELYVTGRLKDLMIFRGTNIYPQDVEETVEGAHEILVPGAGAVFSLTLDEGEALVAVHEVSRHFDPAAADEVLAAVRRRIIEQHDIPPHAIVLIRVGTLPKTSSGKIRRSACRDLYLRGDFHIMAEWNADARSAPGAPEPAQPLSAALEDSDRVRELAAWIRARVAVHLKQDAAAVPLDRPFADLGLDSVGAAQLIGELETHLSTQLSETLPFEYGNIRALARGLVAEATPAATEAPRPADRPLASSPASSGNSEIDDILDQLDALPPEESSSLKHSLLKGQNSANNGG